MTEPKEPKIVHFQPRAQAPTQDTAGNWEPDEQLFGLEELLQQLPPIRKLHLEKGKLTDLVRLYPDMKRTFDAPELLSEAVIASAMVRRRMELLLFRSDDKREAGYALVTVCSPYGYVLVHALTIYPFLRGQLLGRVAIELIARCYAGKKGILYCLSRTCKLQDFFSYILRNSIVFDILYIMSVYSECRQSLLCMSGQYGCKIYRARSFGSVESPYSFRIMGVHVHCLCTIAPA